MARTMGQHIFGNLPAQVAHLSPHNWHFFPRASAKRTEGMSLFIAFAKKKSKAGKAPSFAAPPASYMPPAARPAGAFELRVVAVTRS